MMKKAALQPGYASAFAAYFIWGVMPGYWKFLAQVPTPLILAHRIIWAFFFYAGILFARKELTLLLGPLRDRRKMAWLFLTSCLISFNWLIFIYAVNSGHILQSSLGYFITPLINILLGLIFLQERLTRIQWISLGLAASGVVLMGVQSQGFPWIALGLAFTFGFYGYFRKKIAVTPLVGSTVEVIWMGIPAFVVLAKIPFPGGQGLPWGTFASLMLGGALTGLPLLLFAQAARLLPLSTLGFIHYVGPSLQFFLAVWVYHEYFPAEIARGFFCIWTALAIFSGELAWRRFDKRLQKPLS